MDDVLYLSDIQLKKLRFIGEQLGRGVYDLVQTSIDEAILDYERSNGEIK